MSEYLYHPPSQCLVILKIICLVAAVFTSDLNGFVILWNSLLLYVMLIFFLSRIGSKLSSLQSKPFYFNCSMILGRRSDRDWFLETRRLIDLLPEELEQVAQKDIYKVRSLFEEGSGPAMFTFPYSFSYSLITYCIGSTFLGGKTFTGVTPCPFFSYKICSAFSFTIYSILGCSAFGSIFSFLISTPIYSYLCEIFSSFLLQFISIYFIFFSQFITIYSCPLELGFSFRLSIIFTYSLFFCSAIYSNPIELLSSFSLIIL